jgi:hypothetical protein
VITNGLVILGLGWETGWPIYLERYDFLRQITNPPLIANDWSLNSLQQTFYNFFGSAGGVLALLSAILLVGVFLAVTVQVLRQERSERSAMTYALLAWVVSLMLQPRLGYAGLMAMIVVYCWSATPNRAVRMWSLGALPYVLAEFPSVVGQMMDIRWLDWSISPAIILGLLTCFVALILLLNEQSSSVSATAAVVSDSPVVQAA